MPGDAGNADTEALDRAGQYLMGAGFLSALVAGAFGLNANDPLVVLLAVALVIVYAIAGWMLIGVGEAALEPAATLALVGALFTFWLLGGPVASFAGSFGQVVVFPLILLLLAFAGGGVLSAAMARTVEIAPAEVRGRDTAAFLLHAAAAPAIWGAFLILQIPDARLTSLGAAFAIGAAGFAALAAATGGRLLRLGCHPRYALAASILILGTNAWYLVEFSAIMAEFAADVGPARGIALIGLLLAAFPVAFSAVALYEVETASRGRAS